MPKVRGEMQTNFDDGMNGPAPSGDFGGSPRGGRNPGSGPSGEALVNNNFDDALLSDVPSVGETPNSMSGLPGRIDGIPMGNGDPGVDGTVDLPDLDRKDRGRTLA